MQCNIKLSEETKEKLSNVIVIVTQRTYLRWGLGQKIEIRPPFRFGYVLDRDEMYSVACMKIEKGKTQIYNIMVFFINDVI